MVRTFFALLLAAAALALLPSAAAAQAQSPFDGIWKGQLVSKGPSQGILLYVSDEGGKTTGFVALLDDSKLQYELLNVARSDDKLSFEYGDPYETGLLPRVKVELKPANGGLAGTWSDTRDHSGTVTFARDESDRQDTPGQQPSLPPLPLDAVVGTWTGEMASPEMRAEIKLILDRDGDKLFGAFIPDVRSPAQFGLEAIYFLNQSVSFYYTDTRGPQPVMLFFLLRLKGETTLEGTFKDESDRSGTLKLILTDKAPSDLR